jgi:hypothetical protein
MINPKTAMFGAILYFFIHQRLYSVKTVTSLSVFVGVSELFRLCLGADRRFWIEAGTLFNSVFWQFPFLGNYWFCMKIMKSRFFMLPTGKKTRVPLCRLFCIRDGYYSHYYLFRLHW